MATALDAYDLLTVTDGLPRPQWDAIASRIEAGVASEQRFDAWTSVARQWLTTLCAAFGSRYEMVESEHFLVALPASMRGKAVLAFAERCRRTLLQSLPGIGAFRTPGKEVIVLFRDRTACGKYLSPWLADGECFWGAQVTEGYPHIAATGTDYKDIEVTIARELTHLSLGRMPTPLWMGEGLARVFSCDITGVSDLQWNPETARSQRQYWNANGLAEFWNGAGFFRVANGQCSMCSELAEVLMRLLVFDHRPRWFGLQRAAQQRLRDFVSEADAFDAGEASARKHLGFSLGYLAARFLGPGDWTPRLADRLEAIGYPMDAIRFVRNMIIDGGGVSTKALGQAMRSRAIEQFGADAAAVLRSWRILRSEDLGAIVEGLIQQGFVSKEDRDSLADFNGQFCTDELFANEGSPNLR